MKVRMRVTLVLFAALVACNSSSPPATAHAPVASLGASSYGFTAPMVSSHQVPAMVALLDGRVLVADFDGSETYLPSANAWSATGSPVTPHFARRTLVRLADGRVLMAGGDGNCGTTFCVTTAGEVFDPQSNTWSPIAPLSTPRSAALAVALGNGRVLVAGGFGWPTYSQQQTAEVFDPATGAWTPVGPPNAAHGTGAAVLLKDGRVLLSDYAPEVFDPVTGSFARVGASADSRLYGVAVLLEDGRVLLTGGTNASTSVFDPATNTFTATSAMASPKRWRCAAARALDGTVLVAGGYDEAGHSLDSIERYNPVSGTWSVFGTLAQARETTVMLVLDSGEGLVVGGAYRSPPPNQNVSNIIGRYQAAELIPGLPCTPTTCVAVGKNCGAIPDGCGGTLECGTCASGTCTAANVCACTPTTCAAEGKTCGTIADGCGGTLACGTCASGTCTAANVCACTPTTCAAEGKTCGTIADGCGGTLACGTCASGTCTAANVCACTPTTCAAEGKTCGTIADGCGGTLACGTCASGTCTAANVCACTPTTCAAEGKTCGTIADGCGATLSCGTCGGGYSCDAVAGACLEVPGQAHWDASLQAPACGGEVASCDSGALVVGRGPVGPEPAAPNTLGGTCPDGTGGFFHSDESLDRLRISTLDGTPFAAGKTVKVEATVWAYYNFTADHLDLYSAADAASPTWTWIGTLTPAAAGQQVLSTTYRLPTGGPRQAIRGVFRYGGAAAPCTTGAFDDRDDLVFPVTNPPDLANPTVSITAPSPGQTVTGDVTLSATAADDVGVTRVEFWVAPNTAGATATLVGTATAPPYSVVWNSRLATLAASYVLTVRAYDTAGHVASAIGVIVADNYGPSVSFTSPADGATVGGSVTLSASATDYSGILQVAYYADGALVGTATTAPYAVTWSTASVGAGSHTLKATAWDKLGNPASTSIGVTVAPTTGGLATYNSGSRAPGCFTFGAACDSGTLLMGRGPLGPEPNSPNTLGGTCADGTAGTYHVDESIDRLKIVTIDGGMLRSGAAARVTATVWAYSTTDVLDVYYASSAASPVWTFAGTATPTTSGLQTLSVGFTLPTGLTQVVRGVFRWGGTRSPCPTGPYDDKDDLIFAVQ